MADKDSHLPSTCGPLSIFDKRQKKSFFIRVRRRGGKKERTVASREYKRRTTSERLYYKRSFIGGGDFRREIQSALAPLGLLSKDGGPVSCVGGGRGLDSPGNGRGLACGASGPGKKIQLIFKTTFSSLTSCFLGNRRPDRPPGGRVLSAGAVPVRAARPGDRGEVLRPRGQRGRTRTGGHCAGAARIWGRGMHGEKTQKCCKLTTSMEKAACCRYFCF